MSKILHAFLMSAALLGSASPARAVPDTALAEPTGMLTLPDAIALALLGNPDLEGFSHAVRAAEARRIQAEARPNPELAAALENVSGSLPGLSESELTISMAHIVELGGKRKARIDAATGDLAVLDLDYEARRLVVVSEVARRFLEGLALERLIAIAREVVETAAQTDTLIGQKVRAGGATPAEIPRAEADLARARIDLESLEMDRDLFRARLAALWGNTTPRFAGVAGALDTLGAVPPLDTLRARAKRSPEVARWDAEIRAREAHVRLARAAGPDLRLEAGYRYLAGSDDHTLVAGVSLPLSLFDRQAGHIASAQALLDQSRSDVARVEIERSLEITEAHLTLARESARIRSLREEVLPRRAAALAEIRTGFERGRFAYLDLLEASRAWTETRREEVLALLDFHRTRARLERLLGGPLDAASTENRNR